MGRGSNPNSWLTPDQMRELAKRKRGYTGGGMREMITPEVVRLLPRREILAWCQKFQNDPWHLAEMPVTSGILSQLSSYGISDMAKILRGEREIESIFVRLTKIIEDIDNRRVVWGILKPEHNVGGGKRAIVYLDPPPTFSRLPRLGPRNSWDVFAVCQHCSGRKWLPVESDGKPHIACYTCLPPSQYRSLGLTASRQKLIREFVRSRHG